MREKNLKNPAGRREYSGMLQGPIIQRRAFRHTCLLVLEKDSDMKPLSHLAVALLVGVATIGCEPTKTSERKSETTTTSEGGTTTTSVEQKVESTPDSATKTTTEKVETTGNNPPPTGKPQ